MSRVLVIGLDGFDPKMAEAWIEELPNLRALMARGIHGPLQSIVQPVTPAAWTAMISGRDPGHFGFTDFTSRVGRSCTDFKLVHARMIQVPTIFSMLAKAGKRVWRIGVPISYPAMPIPNGGNIACFMAPSIKSGIASSPELQQEVLAATSSPYVLDVAVSDQAQDADRDDLLRQIREMDRQRFDIAAHVIRNKPWDLLFMTAMGTDRVGHCFMRFQDPEHGRYEADSRYQNAIRDCYRYCDERIGELIELAGPETTVLVVSDHGMQRMDGKVNLNEWLLENGYLHLTEAVEGPTPLRTANVDWGRTRAFAKGYGGQIYLNVRGREQAGCVEPGDADALLDEIAAGLEKLTAPDGRPLSVQAFRGRDLYSGPHADRCPDLCVQFDECRYLTSDLIGLGRLVTPIRDLGFDDGAHAPDGFFAMAGPEVPMLGRFAALHLYDVAPTVLDLLGQPVPSDWEGQPVHKVDDDVYSAEEEAELTNRLRSMYLE